MLKTQFERISFEEPALAPMAHTRFCMQYPSDCVRSAVDFRHRDVVLTVERWNELNSVNRAVNRGIIPRRIDGGVLADAWLISPRSGDCNDYAVTKRHELLARGWPSRALLLSEVVTPSGEHHLILVVRTKDADLVLDNLAATIRPSAMTEYEWVRVESPSDPKLWRSVNVPSALRTAMLPQQ